MSANACESKDLEAAKDGGQQENQQTVMFLGYFSISKEGILRALLYTYAIFFAVHRVADLTYLATVDAKFPKGLEYLYNSDAQRKTVVSYIRQTILCAMLHETANFCVVMVLVFSGTLVKTDNLLAQMLSSASRTLEPCLRRLTCCDTLLCCPCRWAQTERMSWSDLFRGAVFLQLFTIMFFMVNVPFKIWFYKINVNFGFVNTLTLPYEAFTLALIEKFKALPTSGWIMVCLKLAFLKCRYGWLLLWGSLMLAVGVLQYHPTEAIKIEFSVLQTFPNIFGVGTGFPLIQSKQKDAPWFSANRIYYRNDTSDNVYETRDGSKGSLTLLNERGRGLALKGANETVAHSKGGFEDQDWVVNGRSAPAARIGFRKGKHLRDELLGLARERKIGIDQVIMIDGSSADTRANAFVAGAGDARVVGLYDTLFLGDGPSKEAAENPVSLVRGAEGEVDVDHMEEEITGVDVTEEGDDSRPLWHRDTTQPMSDAEVLAILGHELGHSDMRHVEMTMGRMTLSTFISFAVWGWMAQSPLVAGAFSLVAPCVHGGVFIFDHIGGPPLEGILKLFTDAATRRQEYQADEYSARISEAYATSLQTSLANLALGSNQDPDTPFYYEVLHDSHPSVAKRWAAVEEVKRKFYFQKLSQ